MSYFCGTFYDYITVKTIFAADGNLVIDANNIIFTGNVVFPSNTTVYVNVIDTPTVGGNLSIGTVNAGNILIGHASANVDITANQFEVVSNSVCFTVPIIEVNCDGNIANIVTANGAGLSIDDPVDPGYMKMNAAANEFHFKPVGNSSVFKINQSLATFDTPLFTGLNIGSDSQPLPVVDIGPNIVSAERTAALLALPFSLSDIYQYTYIPNAVYNITAQTSAVATNGDYFTGENKWSITNTLPSPTIYQHYERKSLSGAFQQSTGLVLSYTSPNVIVSVSSICSLSSNWNVKLSILRVV